MNAIALSMFKETFKNYLHRCWLIASGKYTSSLCELPNLHLCARHFMKNAKKLVKRVRTYFEVCEMLTRIVACS